MKGAEFQQVLAINGKRYRSASRAAQRLIYDMVLRQRPEISSEGHVDYKKHCRLQDIIIDINLPVAERDVARREYWDMEVENEAQMAKLHARFMPRVFDICVKAGLAPC